MRVLVVGSGGREHALASALSRTAEVLVAPGNAGMARAGVRCTAAPPEEAAAGCDLVVVGPEAPLVDGLADRLRAAGTPTFGPGADGARLEGSKAHLKAVVSAAGVPTAAYRAFGAGQADDAEAYLRTLQPPWVVKTSGLAAGKGVLVTHDLSEAVADLRAKLSGVSFGEAGTTVVVEEGMTGPELSVLAVCDGRPHEDGVVLLPPARDHKRALDGDAGPNTGGMGAFSPVPGVGRDVEEAVLERMVLPTLAALAADGAEYRGVLYAGVMLTADGPRLVEFNVRFGDPEAQVVLPRLEGDVAALLASAAAGRVDPTAVKVRADAAVGVVVAAPGYPEQPRLGGAVHGIEEAEALDGVSVFAAGIGEGCVATGGRIVCVTALGETVASARQQAYRAVDLIQVDGGSHHRGDIAVSG